MYTFGPLCTYLVLIYAMIIEANMEFYGVMSVKILIRIDKVTKWNMSNAFDWGFRFFQVSAEVIPYLFF